MISYSGTRYDLNSGIPTLHDLCVAHGRLPRWCGATLEFWPLLMHDHMVGDLLASYGPRMELAATTHDIAEGAGLGDIASPLKSTQNRRAEKILRSRFAKEVLGLDLEAEWTSPILKEADLIARDYERQFLFGFNSVVNVSRENIEICKGTRAKYFYLSYEYLEANGQAVGDLQSRIERLVAEVKREDSRKNVTGYRAGRIGPFDMGCHPGTYSLQPLWPDPPSGVPGGQEAAQTQRGAGYGTSIGADGLAYVASERDRSRGVEERASFISACSVCGAEFDPAASAHYCHPDLPEHLL